MQAVDVDAQRRIVQILRDEDVGCRGRGAEACRNALGHLVSGLQIGAADLDVDGRGRSHVDHGIHQAAGREIGRQLRHFLGQAPLDARDILIAANLVSRVSAQPG